MLCPTLYVLGVYSSRLLSAAILKEKLSGSLLSSIDLSEKASQLSHVSLIMAFIGGGGGVWRNVCVCNVMLNWHVFIGGVMNSSPHLLLTADDDVVWRQRSGGVVFYVSLDSFVVYRRHHRRNGES